MNHYKAYFSLESQIKSKGIEVDRTELIEAYTNNKKSSLKALSRIEYLEFLSWLKTSFDLNPRWLDSPENKMRRKIIALFKKMGYVNELGKADMRRINNWSCNYGFGKKPLNDYTKKELPKLVTQAEKAYQSYLNSI